MDFLSPLLQWLNANPEFAGIVTFLISAGESVAILGTIVPGTIMMTALGTLAGAGVIPLWGTIIWAILGAIVGDGISYWVGYYFKDQLKTLWPFSKHPGLLKTGETFFLKYGAMSVFIGRFVGPVRALIPLVAGMLGMQPLLFTIANVTSAIGWAPLYMLPGIALGAASLELPPDIAIHVMVVILLITLFSLLCLWFFYKALQLIHNQTQQLQIYIWTKMRKSRRLGAVTSLLKLHNQTDKLGQLNRAFYFVITIVAFLCLAISAKIFHPANFTINQVIYHLFRGIRFPEMDRWVIALTMLGQKEILLPAIVLFAAYLFCIKRGRVAWHALMLGFITAGSIFVLKHWIATPRPIGIFIPPITTSMPSGHATLTTAFFLALAALIAPLNSRWWRKIIYVGAFILILLVSLSRLYLGLHWFTDITASWLLGVALLLFVIVSLQRENEAPLPALPSLLVAFGILSVCSSIFYHTHFKLYELNYTLVPTPVTVIEADAWWAGEANVTSFRTSLFGFPSEAINVEWVGNLASIRKTLIAEGWDEPPVRDWISTLHRIADIKSTQFLPLVSPQYMDQKPELVLARTSKATKNLIVIRLWSGRRKLSNSREPLWVGFVGPAPRSYDWLYHPHREQHFISTEEIFATGKSSIRWQTAVVTIPSTKPKREPHVILLIKKY